MVMELERLTGRVIGAAIEVHRTLGPGFIESIYEKALTIELEKRGIGHQCQVIVPVFYDGIEVGEHRLDILVEGKVVVELKTISDFKPIHYMVVRSYLKATRLKHGLLINFAQPTLVSKRVMCESRRKPHTIGNGQFEEKA